MNKNNKLSKSKILKQKGTNTMKNLTTNSPSRNIYSEENTKKPRKEIWLRNLSKDRTIRLEREKASLDGKYKDPDFISIRFPIGFQYPGRIAVKTADVKYYKDIDGNDKADVFLGYSGDTKVFQIPRKQISRVRVSVDKILDEYNKHQEFMSSPPEKVGVPAYNYVF